MSYPEPKARPLKDFCAAHGFSLRQFYNLPIKPRVIRIGRKIVITEEAGADWRREMEELAAADQAEAVAAA